MKPKTSIALGDWVSEIQRIRKTNECDPNAMTLKEFMANFPPGEMKTSRANRYMATEIQAGRVERCCKLVDGRSVAAYRRVKK